MYVLGKMRIFQVPEEDIAYLIEVHKKRKSKTKDIRTSVSAEGFIG